MEPFSTHIGTEHVISRRSFSLGLSGWLASQLAHMPGLATFDLSVVTARIADARSQIIVDAQNRRTAGYQNEEHDTLMADARVAWHYFENWQVMQRPVIPGTLYTDGDKLRGYPILTMWDIASLINACVSAYLLGIISSEKLEMKGRQIVAVLRRSGTSFRNGSLPSLEISSTNFPSKKRGFDATDTGRLLISLKILDNITRQSLGITKLVNLWRFQDVIRNGTVLNVVGGSLQSFPINSYSRYTARGYRLWGYNLSSSLNGMLPQLSELPEADFFKAMAKMGRVATEPLATEIVETGVGPETSFLADMLLAAQMKRYRTSGKLTCVSEGNIDQAPWFTYNACQFLPEGNDLWVVDFNRRSDGEIVKDRQDKMLTISTKGCFLWEAVRPGTYSRTLVDLARKNASNPKLGFMSGVYELDQRHTNCTDINTNGLILEAIAFIINGRRSLLELSTAKQGT